MGQAAGPALGGAITDALGWRWLFWLVLPVAALTVVALRLTTPESTDPEASRKIDVPGILTIGAAAFALLFALTEARTPASPTPRPRLIVGSVVLTALWSDRAPVEPRRSSTSASSSGVRSTARSSRT